VFVSITVNKQQFPNYYNIRKLISVFITAPYRESFESSFELSSCRSISILPLYKRLSLLYDVIVSGTDKTSKVFSSPGTCPALLVLFDFITLMTFGEK